MRVHLRAQRFHLQLRDLLLYGGALFGFFFNTGNAQAVIQVNQRKRDQHA